MAAETAQTLVDVDCERAVLGSMMLDGQCIGAVLGILAPDDFYTTAHRHIAEAICRLTKAATPIDLLTLHHELRGVGQIEEIGGLAYLSSLEQYVMTTANVLHHARIVKHQANVRALYHAVQDAQYEITSGELPVEQVAGGLREQVEDIIRGVKDGTSNLEPIVGELEAVRRRKEGRASGVPTGFADLDALTLGFQPGNLILLAARPSHGKSAFTLNVALNIARRDGQSALFFSLEMSQMELYQRLLAQWTNIPIHKVRSGHITEQEIERMEAALPHIQQTPLWINDTAAADISQICADARVFIQQHPLVALIVVDYLQLARASEIAKREGRTREVSEISGRLKQLAREMKVPVLAVSQLSREIERRGKRARPQLSDLRESGSLEQDADLVLFLHRDMKNEPPLGSPEHPRAWLEIAKHRNGPTGEIQMLFRREVTEFVNLDKAYWRK